MDWCPGEHSDVRKVLSDSKSKCWVWKVDRYMRKQREKWFGSQYCGWLWGFVRRQGHSLSQEWEVGIATGQQRHWAPSLKNALITPWKSMLHFCFVKRSGWLCAINCSQPAVSICAQLWRGSFIEDWKGKLGGMSSHMHSKSWSLCASTSKTRNEYQGIN